jgi:hypothetical protein
MRHSAFVFGTSFQGYSLVSDFANYYFMLGIINHIFGYKLDGSRDREDE